MRYIHFFGNNGYCGTDYHEFMSFEDDTTDKFIDLQSNEFAYDCADTYSYLATGWEDGFESGDEEDEYFENTIANYGWEELSKEDWEDLKEDYE